MVSYLEETEILNFKHPEIRKVISKLDLSFKSREDKIHAIYDFVRDEIKFGYNKSDDVSASEVLSDGYGQCNTKTSLFMALSRALGLPCKAHFFKINKRVQKGIFPSHIYRRHVEGKITHSWPEVWLKDRWVVLEGIILDKDYLCQIKNRFNTKKRFEGYGVSVSDLSNLSTDWSGKDTYVQKESVTRDEGIFASPDDYYKKYGTNVNGLGGFLFKCIVRHLMDRKVINIRSGKW